MEAIHDLEIQWIDRDENLIGDYYLGSKNGY